METIAQAVEGYHDAASVTSGQFATEEDAAAAFCKAFSATDCFNMYAEVDCWYFGGSVFGDRPTGRIDFVLTPRKKLIDAGWRMGVVGVEIKKSGHKAGPLICQMIDYSKAIYRLPDACGSSLVCLTAVFCFPHIEPGGREIGSIMANHRLGGARITKWGANLTLNSTNVFLCDSESVRCKPANCGFKNGSR